MRSALKQSASHRHLEYKEATGGDPDAAKIASDLAKAFAEFKTVNDNAIAELKKGKADVVTAEKVDRISTALDNLIVAKDTAEKKSQAQLDDIEKRIARHRLNGSDDGEKREAECKSHNLVLQSAAAERGRPFAALDANAYDGYKAAQGRYLREGKEALSADEVKTLSVGSDPDGGYFVTPDVNGRVVKKVYETSPVRQIASVITISTDALEGVEDLEEAGAGYAGEQSQGSDTTTPKVGKWRIPVFWVDTEPKATQQLLDDSGVNIEQWLADKVADKFSRFENKEFVTGDATRIRGITGYDTASDSGSGVTWGKVGFVASGASADFASSNPADKIHDLIGTLKQAYLANARFLTRRSVITKIRKFKDGMGNYLWQPSFVAGVAETIMGYPVARAEDMPALAANSYSLAFGDFAQAYQIVDRMGIRVLRDPYTSKPYVKFYTTKRVGGGVVNFEAYKLMKFAT